MTFPDWLVPMAATLTQERFTGPEWTFERKYDGIRMIACKRGADVRLYSRNHLPQHVPAVADAIAGLPHDELILDGELSWDQRDYHVFDLLWCDGRDLRELPLDARRAELATLPLRHPLWRTTVVDDPEPWERARREGCCRARRSTGCDRRWWSRSASWNGPASASSATRG